MTTCPLPIDWLDLLAGRPSAASRAHLDQCPSCRAVVDSLTHAQVGSPDLTALSDLAAMARHDVRLAGPPSDEPPSIGDIFWLVADSNTAVKSVVLILDAFNDYLELAFDVAPLWVDDDNAVPSDLLLSEADSTTGNRWRVAFRHQTVITERALESRIGSLTDSGMASLRDALTGFIPAARTGVPLESDFDPRLSADNWMRESLIAATVNEEDVTSSDQSMGDVHDAAADIQEAEFLSFVFKITRKREETQESYRLAAAQAEAGRLVTEAILHNNTYAIHVVARLWLDAKSDQLRFRPLEVSGVTRSVFLIIHSRHLQNPVEVETTLNVDEEVTLASGVGISERDVELMEMQLR